MGQYWKAIKDAFRTYNNWGKKKTEQLPRRRPVIVITDKERFGREQNWGFIQMYAQRMFDYLGIEPIPVLKATEEEHLNNTGNALAFYNSTHRVIVVYDHGYYKTTIKHEVTHYFHHLILGEEGWANHCSYIGKSPAPTANHSNEELLTQQQEQISWASLKQWGKIKKDAQGSYKGAFNGTRLV